MGRGKNRSTNATRSADGLLQRAATQTAIATLLSHPELLVQCDTPLPRVAGEMSQEPDRLISADLIVFIPSHNSHIAGLKT